MVQQTKGIFDGLNLKPDIQTFLESEIDGPQHDLENAKTPGGGCRVVLRIEPLHHKSAYDALKVCYCPLRVCSLEAITIKYVLFHHMLK